MDAGAAANRADVVDEKKQDSCGIQQATPLLQPERLREIAEDSQNHGEMQQTGMEIKDISERQCQSGDRRQYDWGVGKNHRKDKTQKDRVQHRIVTGSGAKVRC